MPGFDATGPRGFGPMTGWGRGFCGTGAGPMFGGGFGRGFGGGFGGGRGRRCRHFASGPGRGMGWRRWAAFGWAGGPYYVPEDPEAAKEELRHYAGNLQASLNAVQAQLDELERQREDVED